MSTVEHFDWARCVICQKSDTKDLKQTEKGLTSLGSSLLEFWKLGKLDLETECLTNIFENGQPNFVKSFLQNKAYYHKNCATKYNKQKLNRILTRKRKISENKPVSSSTRSIESSQQFGSYFCAICSTMDESKKLCAAGTWHAKKGKVDIEHNKKLTANFAKMALAVGNDGLLKAVSVGDLAANEIYYHKNCYKTLVADYKKVTEKGSNDNQNVAWKKSFVFDKVVQFMYNENSLHPGKVFRVKEINEMYVYELKEDEIVEQPHVTRFRDRLLKNVKNLNHKMVENTSVVFFDDVLDDILKDQLQCPDDFFRAMRKVVQPIRRLVFQSTNTFPLSFSANSQFEALPTPLLALTRMLVDGNSFEYKGFRQASLTCAQLIPV